MPATISSSHSSAAIPRECPLLPGAQASKPEPGPKHKGLKKRSALESPLRYGIANCRKDLDDAFGLMYRSYRRAGLVDANEHERRLTPYHFLPTTEVFITRYQDEVVSTVTLTGDGRLGLPLESAFPKETKDLRSSGFRMGEIGCLADRRHSPVRFIETFATMGRMLAQVAMARGYDGLVAAAHPKHARLYKRVLPFEQVGDVIECPYANGNPAVMLQLTFDDHKGSSLYQRFFGSMQSDMDLVLRPLSQETKMHFYRFLQSDQHLPADVMQPNS